MEVKLHNLFAIFMLVLSAIVLQGCGSTDPSRFYLLTPLQEAEAVQPDSGKALSIAVGPVNLPEYLDRPQIVTRFEGNEIRLAEFDRWAEPLGANMTRTIAENLSRLLATDQITLFPWKGPAPLDCRVAVDVIRFDADELGQITLKACWTLYGDQAEKPLQMQKSNIVISGGEEGDYKSMVSMKSEALATLCQEIAEAIEAVAEESAPKS